MAPLRVAFDTGPLHGHLTGIGHAVAALHDGLAARGDVVTVDYLLSFRAQTRPGTTRLPLPAAVAVRAWAAFDAPRVDRWLGDVDVVHGTNYVVPPSRRPRIVSVYDVWFLRAPAEATPAVRRAAAAMRRAVRDGAVVHTSSHATAGAVREILPEARVRTVHLGASPVPCAPEGAPHPDLIGQRFILALGTVERRKNLPRLVAAFGHCAAHAPHLLLVIAGAPGDDSDAVDRAIDRLGPARSRVLRTGAVDAATRAWLLRHAAVIAYPSLDEGFGFPVLDAFSVGVPLVASTAGSIPEVAGDAALLVPPLDVDALAAAISRAIDDDDLRARLVGLGNDRRHAFSWETCAEQMVDLYHRVARGDRELGGEDGPGCADAPTSTT